MERNRVGITVLSILPGFSSIPRDESVIQGDIFLGTMHHPSGHRSPPSGDYDSIKGANDRLRHFVVLGKLRWVRECVLKEKADVNYRDPTSGYTALHM
eukprot:1352852-Amorphochlora_amoeboformis.AAC.1